MSTTEAPAKILVVDDDKKNVKLVEALLVPSGYEVVKAYDGGEALHQAVRERPDLVLLDVMMPVMDGFEVCKRLKNGVETRLIPVVIMTALGQVEDRIRGIEAGADDFLTKPVHRDELMARIRTSVRLKQTIEREMGLAQREESGSTGGNVFRCEGEYWTLAYEGSVRRIRDTKGLQHVAHLLRHPGQQFDVRELAAEAVARAPRGRHAGHEGDDTRVSDLGDAGPVLDAEAKAAYKQRLEELHAELGDAEQLNDLGRAEAAREEIDFLTQQLTAAIGLGGRDRKAGAHAERARLTVTKRIKDALQKIRDSHPALGNHLIRAIKTGYFCSYTCEPDQPITWTL